MFIHSSHCIERLRLLSQWKPTEKPDEISIRLPGPPMSGLALVLRLPSTALNLILFRVIDLLPQTWFSSSVLRTFVLLISYVGCYSYRPAAISVFFLVRLSPFDHLQEIFDLFHGLARWFYPPFSDCLLQIRLVGTWTCKDSRYKTRNWQSVSLGTITVKPEPLEFGLFITE